jgi:hypothetical protein
VDDNTPIYDVLFEMQMSLCERFPSITPLNLRREKARDVFAFFIRYIKYSKKHKKQTTKDGKKIIRRRASDNAGWW